MPNTPANILVGDGTEQTIVNKVFDDPKHGWVAGFRHSAPPRKVMTKIFHSIMDEGPFDSERS